MMIVYRIRNMVTGQNYIGVTKSTLAARCAGHRANATRGVTYPLLQAIRDLGWEHFEATELSRAESSADALQMEKAAIVLFKALVPNGYNLTPGGNAKGVISESTRQKLSKAMQGRKPPVLTPEGRARMIAKRSGSNNWRARPIEYHGTAYRSVVDAMEATGLTRNQFNRRLKLGLATYLTPVDPRLEHLSLGSWNKGRRHTPEELVRMSASRKGAQNWNARAVEIEGIAYPCLDDAAKALGLSRGQIYRRITRGAARFLTNRRLAN